MYKLRALLRLKQQKMQKRQQIMQYDGEQIGQSSILYTAKRPSVYEVHNSYAQNGKDHAKSEE